MIFSCGFLLWFQHVLPLVVLLLTKARLGTLQTSEKIALIPAFKFAVAPPVSLRFPFLYPTGFYRLVNRENAPPFKRVDQIAELWFGISLHSLSIESTGSAGGSVFMHSNRSVHLPPVSAGVTSSLAVRNATRLVGRDKRFQNSIRIWPPAHIAN